MTDCVDPRWVNELVSWLLAGVLLAIVVANVPEHCGAACEECRPKSHRKH